MKKSKLAIAIAALCLLVALAAIPALAADTTGGGLTFRGDTDDVSGNSYGMDTYQTVKDTSVMPVTLEAWVYVPSSAAEGALGTLYGNFWTASHYGMAYINWEIIENATPQLKWNSSLDGETYEVTFSSSQLPTNEWTHLAIVYDGESGVVSCYVNGDFTEQKYYYPEIDPDVLELPMMIGGDNRTLNTNYFKGEIGDITVYSDVRSAEEIYSDFGLGLEGTTAGTADLSDAVCYYDIDSDDFGKNIADETGNGYDIIYSKTWLTEEEAEAIRQANGFTDYDYSFAIMGDTQMTTDYYPANLPAIYQWIVDNKDKKNIAFAIGLGDITNDNGRDDRYERVYVTEDETDDGLCYLYDEEKAAYYYYIKVSSSSSSDAPYTQWDVAYDAITLLDGYVPYSLIRGNHDVYPDYSGVRIEGFNTYFENSEWFTSQFTDGNGGTYGGSDLVTGYSVSYANTYQLLEDVGTEKIDYLILNLDWKLTASVIAWANEVVAAYPNHKVIINTHAYMNGDGTTLDPGDPTPRSGYGGDVLWEELASKHENIVMVLSGHIDNETIVTNRVKGDNGNTVTEILINPQGFDAKLGGAAMIAMFYFDASGEKVNIEWYSATKNMYYKNANVFTLNLSASAEERVAPAWDGATVSQPSGSGTEADPYLIANAENLAWISTKITEGSVSFAGKYFRQTADIDLGGNVLTSIGSYYINSSSMAAFGGIYDGCGYSIKNGTITGGKLYTNNSDTAPERYFNLSEGYGLFGVIYGATVKNVTLDDVQVIGRGVTGAIVGRAAAPAVTETALACFNQIVGCEVTDSVRIVTLLPDTDITEPSVFDDEFRAGRVGSICGMAYAALIKGCTSAAEFSVDGSFGLVGGIVGTAGLNSSIEYCSFTGGITLADNNSSQPSYFGGIVGAVSPSASTADFSGDTLDISGTLYIGDCYNGGYFVYNGAEIKTDVCWGGIAGFFGDLSDVENDSLQYPFLIENCYNLYAKERENSSMKVSGIVAYATPGEKTLYIKNSYSVAVDVDEGENNEYRFSEGATGVDGLNAIVAENCATLAASDMSSYVESVDSGIASVKANGVSQSWIIGTGEPSAAGTDGLKYFDMTGNVYYLYSDGAWSAVRNLSITENSLDTDYGTIPNEYAMSPIVLFVDKGTGEYSFVGGYDTLTAVVDAAISGSNGLPYNPSYTAVVYFRADVTSTTATSGNLGYSVGTIIFDLNGKTLTQANSKEPLFRGYSKYLAGAATGYPDAYYLPAYYTIKNGNIVLNSHGLFRFGMDGSAYNNYTGPSPYETKSLYWTLDGVNISLAEGATLTSLIGEYNEHTDLKVQKATHLDLTVNDNCVIDITNAPSGFVLFDAYDPITEGMQSNGVSYYTNSIVNVTVGACEIIAADSNFILEKIHPSNGSSVTFTADDEGNYATVTIGGASYSHEALYTPYGYINPTYADASAYNTVVFQYSDGAYKCVMGYSDFYTALASDSGVRAYCAKAGTVAVAYQRTDYDVKSNISGNIGYICGTMIIDLGGHTVTQSNAGPLFRAYAKYNKNNGTGNSTFKLINGSIALTNHSLFYVGLEGTPYANDITSVKTVNWTLDNIKITVASGVSNVFTEFSEYGSNKNDGRQMIFNLTVNDNCVIDITSAAAGAVLFGANDTNIINTEGTTTRYTNSIVNINVGACSILAASGNDPVWYSVNEDNGSSVTFAKNEEGKGATVTVGEKSYTYESLCTPYGHTTLKYADYPISVFEYVDGAYVFNIGYATFDLISSVNALCLSTEKKAVICLRDDIDTANYTSTSYVSGNLGWNVGTIIIDLNGHTLTQGANNTLFRAYAKYKSTTSSTSGRFEIINGNIVLNSYGIFEVGAEGTPYSNATTTKTLYWTLDNVNISFQTGASAMNLIQFEEKLKVARTMTMDLTITDSCVIDLTNAPADFLLFNANETTSTYTDSIVNIYVEGVKIIGGMNSFEWYKVNESNNSSVTFGKSEDGNYMYIVLPKSAFENFDTSEVLNGGDGAELSFIRVAADDNTVTYRLGPVELANVSFAPKMSITLDRDLIMNVYVPVNYLVKFTFNGVEYADLEALEESKVEINGAYYYRMQVPLAAAEAAKSIKLIASITVGETSANGTFTFNIMKYAESVIASSDCTDTEKQLVKDTLAYVRAAYTYFGKTDEDAMAAITEILGEGYDESSVPTLDGSADTPAEGLSGVTLVLDATPAIRFYYKDYDASSYGFYADGVKLNTVTGTDSKGAYIEIDVYAYVMSKTITYTIDGDEAGSYHINSYYTFVTTNEKYKDNAELISLVARFAKYCESAYAYRNEQVSN